MDGRLRSRVGRKDRKKIALSLLFSKRKSLFEEGNKGKKEGILFPPTSLEAKIDQLCPLFLRTWFWLEKKVKKSARRDLDRKEGPDFPQRRERKSQGNLAGGNGEFSGGRRNRGNRGGARA